MRKEIFFIVVNSDGKVLGKILVAGQCNAASDKDFGDLGCDSAP